jgi:hypothetical protein
MSTLSLRYIGIAVALAAAVLGGCKGTTGGGGSGGNTNAAAVGVWSGTDSATGGAITALIDSKGHAQFMRADGVLFSGSVQVSVDTLAMTVNGYSEFPAAFSDKSTHGIGTVNGTVVSGNSISATLTFTTDGGTPMSGTWTLSFEPLSNDSSGLTQVSGNYTDNVTGTVLSINTNGAMTSQNPTNGCVLNGTISTADSTHNIYQVAFSYDNCTGTYTGLNGVQLSGLATLNSHVSPAQLTMAASGSSASAYYAVVSGLNAS